MMSPPDHPESTGQDKESEGEYDLFPSHAIPDKAWVLTLAEGLEALEALGLRVFVDNLEIDPGDNWVIRISDALERSRYLVLVLSDHTSGRPWVLQEWTSFMAGHGPLGRLLPVKIDALDLPFILKSTQAIDATHRDARLTAEALFQVVGDPAPWPRTTPGAWCSERTWYLPRRGRTIGSPSSPRAASPARFRCRGPRTTVSTSPISASASCSGRPRPRPRSTPSCSATHAPWAACCSRPCSTRPMPRGSPSSSDPTAPAGHPGAQR